MIWESEVRVRVRQQRLGLVQQRFHQSIKLIIMINNHTEEDLSQKRSLPSIENILSKPDLQDELPELKLKSLAMSRTASNYLPAIHFGSKPSFGDHLLNLEETMLEDAKRVEHVEMNQNDIVHSIARAADDYSAADLKNNHVADRCQSYQPYLGMPESAEMMEVKLDEEENDHDKLDVSIQFPRVEENKVDFLCQWDDCSAAFKEKRDLILHLNEHVDQLQWKVRYIVWKCDWD
jgi:hypothetical protein